MESRINKPAVLVTGGARRIGAIIARAFGMAGWHVLIHYGHSRAEAEALARALPSAECVGCDLADSDAAVAMVMDLAGRQMDWHVLVNSAAVFPYDGPHALILPTFTEAMAVNALTPIRMTQAFLAAPRQPGYRGAGHRMAGRRAIHLTDMKLANPNPDFFSYTLAKQALAAGVRMMAMAIADGTVGHAEDRVYGLAPGAMLPSFDQSAQEHETSGRMNLLRRLTHPEELADAALFLAEGWLANGETVFIDSGQHLLAQSRDVLYLARALAPPPPAC